MIQNGYVNQTQIMGNLTVTPEIEVSKTNHTYCKFALAVNRWNAKTQESTPTFVNAVAYGKTAEYIVKKYEKGDKLYVQGNLQNDRYKDEVKGTYKDSVILTVEQVTLASKPKDKAREAIENTLTPPPPTQSYMQDAPDPQAQEYEQASMLPSPVDPSYFDEYEELESNY